MEGNDVQGTIGDASQDVDETRGRCSDCPCWNKMAHPHGCELGGIQPLPWPQMPEQMMTVRRIQELGLGTALDENTLTVEQLHAMIKAALSNVDYRKNAQAMQQHVRNACGYKRAADAIMNFAQSQRQATTQA